MALVEHVPRALYEKSLQAAFQICAWASVRTPDAPNAAEFWRTVQNRIVSPLEKTLPPGKSTLQVLRAAYRKSIFFSHLGSGIYQLGWGSRARRIDRSSTDGDTVAGNRLSQNKVLASQLLRQAGLPVPENEPAANEAEALAAARKLGWPLVVKPADADRGEGVSVDVTDEATLKRAFATARRSSPTVQVIIERQVIGVCHRLFVAFGRVLYCVKRWPMGVVGDGEKTVAQLVAAALRCEERKPPWERSKLKPVDNLARKVLAGAGYTEASVPAAGARVDLRRIETTAWGGVDEDTSEAVHPANREVALAAARLFGLEVAGIDIICDDISRPWYESGAVINEVNHAPLLGGGEISRERLPDFLEALLDGDGRVPVDVFVGGAKAWTEAQGRWRAQCARKRRCWLTDGRRTMDGFGSQQAMAVAGLYRRVRALILDSRVDALVLVVHDDELLESGLPLEAVDRVRVVDRELVSAGAPEKPLSSERVATLLDLLEGWGRGVVGACLRAARKQADCIRD
jgi:D-alanine-D-alanine ligase-like ATP-grasp enzyme